MILRDDHQTLVRMERLCSMRRTLSFINLLVILLLIPLTSLAVTSVWCPKSKDHKHSMKATTTTYKVLKWDSNKHYYDLTITSTCQNKCGYKDTKTQKNQSGKHTKHPTPVSSSVGYWNLHGQGHLRNVVKYYKCTMTGCGCDDIAESNVTTERHNCKNCKRIGPNQFRHECVCGEYKYGTNTEHFY